MNIKYIMMDNDILKFDLPKNALICFAIIKNCNDFGINVSRGELTMTCKTLAGLSGLEVRKSISKLEHEHLIEENTTTLGNQIVTRYKSIAPVGEYKPHLGDPIPNTIELEKEWKSPKYEEVKAYAQERCCDSLAEPFFNYYDNTGWRNKNGRRLKNWKQTFLTWERTSGQDKYHAKKTVE